MLYIFQINLLHFIIASSSNYIRKKFAIVYLLKSNPIIFDIIFDE